MIGLKDMINHYEKDLVKNGFDIGSHTENHPPLTKRKEDQLKNQFEDVRNFFKSKISNELN